MDWFVGLLGAATVGGIALLLVVGNVGLLAACGFLWVCFGPGTITHYLKERRNGPTYRRSGPREPFVPWVDRYGEEHQALRAQIAEKIRQRGGTCMERICVMPSRRIEPTAYWHLAHDHESGGAHDYLGPSHPECNEAEARGRGVTWAGMDSHDANNPWAGRQSRPDEPAQGQPDANNPWSG